MPLDDFDAAEPRQPQIDQCDIRLMLAKLRDGLHAVRGLTHHFQAFRHVQQRNQPLAHHVVVFHNQYANRFLGHDCSFADSLLLSWRCRAQPDRRSHSRFAVNLQPSRQ